MKRVLKTIAATCAAVCFVLPLAACGSKEEEKAEVIKSGLIGTFTYQETLGNSPDKPLHLTTNAQEEIIGRTKLYSTLFPLDDCNNVGIVYNMDQRLKLNRDYTYKYDYTVQFSNPGEWGGQVARFEISISGAFEYRASSAAEGVYSVLLSDPVSGTQTIYAPNVTHRYNIYDWKIHSQPDCIIEYEAALMQKNYKVDQYAASRMVVVDKTEKSVRDDIFYPDLFNHVISYCTYTV